MSPARTIFPVLRPEHTRVEVQMFGFQTAHKQIQIGPDRKPGRVALELQPRQREPQRAGAASPAATRRLPRSAGTTPTSWNSWRRPRRKIPLAAVGNANEAFLVNGSLSNGLQTGQDDFGLRGPVFGSEAPAASGAGSKASLAGSGAPGVARRWSRSGAAAVHSVVDVVAAVDSAADAAEGVRRPGGQRRGREATADSLAIARIADARAFTEMCRSSGTATTRMPSILAERPACSTAEFQQLPLERRAGRAAADSAPAERRFHVLHVELLSARAARARSITSGPSRRLSNAPEIFHKRSSMAWSQLSTIPPPARPSPET